jgi:hypothetical protein
MQLMFDQPGPVPVLFRIRFRQIRAQRRHGNVGSHTEHRPYRPRRLSVAPFAVPVAFAHELNRTVLAWCRTRPVRENRGFASSRIAGEQVAEASLHVARSGE